MRYRVADSIDAVAGQVAPCLVGAGPSRQVGRVADLLPAPLAEAFYLECRLRSEATGVDLIVRVGTRGREVLAGRNPRYRLPEPLRSVDAWARIVRFARAWADEPALLRSVDSLWLEFDLQEQTPGVPATGFPPSVFVGFTPQAMAGFTTADWIDLLDRLLSYLGSDHTTPGRRRAIRSALAGRPPGASIPYIGFMLGRPSQPVRLYVDRISARPLGRWLESTGWPGSTTELRTSLEQVAGSVPGVAPGTGMAHLDIEDSVDPRIGIEFTLLRRQQLRAAIAECSFLDRLVSLGLCSHAKRLGLLAWPGYGVRTLPHELWPSIVVRRVNSIKIVHQPGAPLEAKGYLLTYWTALPRRWNVLHRWGRETGASVDVAR